MSAKNSIIADSGFWIALFHQKDPYHQAAVSALDKFADRLLIVTWPVIVEASHLLLQRAGFQRQVTFLQTIQRGGADIFDLDEQHLSRICVLMEKYQSLPMDLADASLVILAEALGHGRILSVDQRDFNAYRWKNQQPFTNLLLPNS
jgi:predicted nucleic acid-binding protein